MPKNYSLSDSMWYVITGGPSSGKTTIIKKLKNLGYIVYPEAARVLIDKERRAGKKLREIRKNEGEFQREVLKAKIKIEKYAPRDKIVFFDRAIPDSIAYYQMCGLDQKEVLKFCERKSYKKIFFLGQLPIKQDYARIEDDKTIKTLNKSLKISYKKLGYNIIDIPIASIRKRVELILKDIKHGKS